MISLCSLSSGVINCTLRGLWSALLAGMAFGCSEMVAQSVPDAIYYGGKIVTLDARSSIAQAIAVREGRIVAVGTSADMQRLAGVDTRLIDLGGRTVVPGLYDNHIHLGVGRNPSSFDWTKVASTEQLYTVLRDAVAKTPEGQWIEAGLSTELMTEDLLPTRADLDRIAPKHPVAIERMHVMLVNSLALEKAGITRDTPNPSGGMIDRDSNGESTGRIRETPAQKLIRAVIPEWQPDPQVARQAIRDSLKGFATLGLTSVNGGMMRPHHLRLVQDVYDLWGPELPRLTMQVRISPGYDTYEEIKEGIAKEIALIEGMSIRTGFGDDRLKMGAIKMSVDGGMTGQAAWLGQPYKGRPDFRGVIRIPEEALYAVGKRAHDLGWQLGIHAIGDAAVESTVRVYDRILRESPRANHRHYIHHWSINPGDETIRKVADLGVIVAIQPNFTWSLAAYYANATEGEKLQRNNPSASLLDRGIRVSYGSDGLPLGPFIGIYAAVTRRATDFRGITSGQVHGPGEKVSVEQALRLYTQGSAYMTFDEEKRGVLEPGKLADFVVISEDILTIDPERIRQIQPLMTVIGGQIVWQAASPTAANQNGVGRNEQKALGIPAKVTAAAKNSSTSLAVKNGIVPRLAGRN